MLLYNSSHVVVGKHSQKSHFVLCCSLVAPRPNNTQSVSQRRIYLDNITCCNIEAADKAYYLT